MRYFGPVISFALSDGAHAERFLASCMLLFEATSFGGVHTTAERRARWGGDEDAQDLIEDISQALDSL